MIKEENRIIDEVVDNFLDKFFTENANKVVVVISPKL